MNDNILGNIDRKELLKILKENLGEKRYAHILSVEKKALELGNLYHVDEIKCSTAALYHDFAKNMTIDEATEILDHYDYIYDEMESNDMNLLHSKVAGILAEHQFGIKDKDVIEAIMYHTTGKERMSLLSKIVFIADAVEDTRIYPDVEMYRKTAQTDIDKALLEILNGQIIFLVNKGNKIHPDTIQARNFLLN